MNESTCAVPSSPSDFSAVVGIQVLNDQGNFTAPTRVEWSTGRFSLGGAPQPTDLDGTNLWLAPGLVDAHLHAAWHAFDQADREAFAADETRDATAHALAATLSAGVTSFRDAGGLHAELLAQIPAARRPRVQLSDTIINRTVADTAGGIVQATEAALEAGARWIKLAATAGVASPAGAGLEPTFSSNEIRESVTRAGHVGAKVMVHAWGGQAIDDAIEHGAASIEHGIFLTEDQARRAAARELTLVPTLRIYQLVQGMIDAGSLPTALRARVDEAVGAHPRAVRLARDAGLAVALGTDYGVRDQHGSNRLEFDALVEAGLTPAEALIAATRSGAALLASAAPEHAELPDGRIAEGSLADAVILRRDPREPGALSDPETIVAVVLGGEVVDGAPKYVAPKYAAPRPLGSQHPASQPASFGASRHSEQTRKDQSS